MLPINNKPKEGSIRRSSRTAEYISELEISAGAKIGYLYLILAHFIISLASYFIQKLHRIPVFQLLFFRGIVLFMVNWIICSTQDIEFYTKSPSTNKKLISRGLASLISFGLLVCGIQNLALSEATTLFQTTPVFTSLFAVYFLKEKFDLTQGITVIMSLLGSLLVLKPPILFGSNNIEIHQEQNRLFGGICCLLSSIIAGAITNLVRDLRNHCHSQTTVHYTATVASLVTPALILFQGVVAPTMQEYFYLMVMALLLTASQILMTRALKFSAAGKSSVLSYSQILFSVIIDVLSNHPLDIISIIGAGCICSCVLLIFFEKKQP